MNSGRTRREEIFGAGLEDTPRFPILIKVLDARDDLSLQVHPPSLSKAAAMGGEPKTEMWFFTKTTLRTRSSTSACGAV